MAMMIHGDMISGNCLKVKYTADYLGLAYNWKTVDVVKGGSRTPEFLAMNPMGQVPTVVFDDGRVLAQSNAIIRFLARNTELLPADAFAAAKVDELLFWEQYSHEPYIAVCRFQMRYLGKAKEDREPSRVAHGEAALDFMEKWLEGKNWFAADSFTIADISLLAYTRFAAEGGFDLETRPSVRAWIGRCEQKLNLETLN